MTIASLSRGTYIHAICCDQRWHDACWKAHNLAYSCSPCSTSMLEPRNKSPSRSSTNVFPRSNDAGAGTRSGGEGGKECFTESPQNRCLVDRTLATENQLLSLRRRETINCYNSQTSSTGDGMESSSYIHIMYTLIRVSDLRRRHVRIIVDVFLFFPPVCFIMCFGCAC